jgi:Ca-activated chloride channel family protein
MRFADPYFLALIALIPILLLLKTRFIRDDAAGRFSNLGLLTSYRPTWRVRSRWLPTAVRALAIALLVVALARPQAGQADSELPGQGIDIALVMDISSSMGTTLSGDESRLQAAQRVIADFVTGRSNDRIGLVVFREESLVLSPLTLDYAALKRLLESVGQLNLSDGTAIGTGLGDGLNLLRESRARSRVAILLTDGQNNAGAIEPAQAARIAETLGIRLYTIGLIENRRASGGQANVDEKALQEMAQVTGGRYFAADNKEALAQIYESIDDLEKSRIGRPQYGAYDELSVYFLYAALALLALEVGLRATLWRQAT